MNEFLDILAKIIFWGVMLIFAALVLLIILFLIYQTNGIVALVFLGVFAFIWAGIRLESR